MTDLYHSRRSSSVAIAIAALLLATGCTGDPPAEDGVATTGDTTTGGVTIGDSVMAAEATIEITNVADGDSVGGNVVELALGVSGIDIVPASEDPGDGGTGQFHVFVDRDPVAPGESIPSDDPAIIETAANPIVLEGLPIGEHRFVVVIGGSDDVRIGDAAAEVSVQVEGPSVQLTGPPTAEVGGVIQVEIEVEGAELLEAADDESANDGSAGHLHLFVNTEPTPAGETIPTDNPAIVHTTSRSVAFPADLFTTGTNVIWVMLGHGDETPFDPRVVDKLEVEVS